MLGNKRIMGQNILYYMERKGLERKDFAKLLNIPYSTLNEWINGNAYPRINRIQQMADFFGIEKADLVEARTAQKDARGIRIPILGKVAAGVPIEMISDVLGEVVMDKPRSGEYFALEIKGDSMSPRIESGDIVVVKKQPNVESGEIAIVAINGDEATCKKVKYYHDGMEIIPLNPSYKTQFFSYEEVQTLPVTIIGKVVELRAKFE